MPGPCSNPDGDRRRQAQLNEIVCNVHFTCDMADFNKKGEPIVHEYITYREWLIRRNKLRTGKTV
jgi:hypothetical protein